VIHAPQLHTGTAATCRADQDDSSGYELATSDELYVRDMLPAGRWCVTGTMDIGEMTYGSDKAGLVCAYRFEPGERGVAISAGEAAE
jgi:hypothetical protein